MTTTDDRIAVTNLAPGGFYDDGLINGNEFANLNADVDEGGVHGFLGVSDPVTTIQVPMAPGETLGDFTRRMYGANTETGRRLIVNANTGSPLKGTVNVPLP